jgi:uncharacterized membrane protein
MFHPQPAPWHESWYGGAHGLIPILLVLVLAGVVIWLVVRLHGLESTVRSMTTSTVTPAAHVAAPKATTPWSDPAVAEARMRFARGELDRDAYLLIAQDLGAASPAPPSTTPPAEGQPPA